MKAANWGGGNPEVASRLRRQMAALLLTRGADSRLKRPNYRIKDKPALRKKREARFPTAALSSGAT